MIRKALFDKKERKYYWEKGDLNTSFGLIKESEMSKEEAVSNTNQKFRVMTANFLDNLEKIKTGPAYTSLKDIGAILTYTGISKDSVIAEAGTGSGFLTSILSRFVKRIESYEKNADFFNLSRKLPKIVFYLWKTLSHCSSVVIKISLKLLEFVRKFHLCYTTILTI